MVTRVMGKVTETYWYVESNYHEERKEDGTVKFVFDKRPKLKSEVRELEPVEICRYEGEPYRFNYLYIGENEVCTKRITFHADLKEYRQFVDKVIKNTDINQEESREKYKALLRGYNKQTIEGDEELLAYCTLHHLDPAETDVDELKKVCRYKEPISKYNSAIDISNYLSNSFTIGSSYVVSDSIATITQ